MEEIARLLFTMFREEVIMLNGKIAFFLGFIITQREANGAADILVKKGRRNGNAPLFLIPVLTLDLSKASINVSPTSPSSLYPHGISNYLEPVILDDPIRRELMTESAPDN